MRCKFLFLAILLVFSLQLASAAVLTGNFTMDWTNKSDSFNFLTQNRNTTGPFAVGSNPTVPWYRLNANYSIRILYLGNFPSDLDGAGFRAKMQRVPNSTYAGAFSWDSYSTFDNDFYVGEAYAFYHDNASGAGKNYGVLFVKNWTSQGNITFEYFFNNENHNNTFVGNISGCQIYTNSSQCLNDYVNQCGWWNGICLPSGQDFLFVDAPPAECDVLPQGPCDAINDSFCSWNSSGSLCKRGGSWDTNFGFNCTHMLNSSICNNQMFTQKTGLCTWNSSNSVCVVNKSKTSANITAPPVFSCEATGYIDNQSGCEDLANKYFLPCAWNNKTTRCEPKFFDFAKFKFFEDIGSENTCKLVGGTWKKETTYDPLSRATSSENWCEFGVQIKKSSQIGAGGSSYSGDSTSIGDCNRACASCEFNPANGSIWSSLGEAETKCGNSSLGCAFRADSNSFSGYGWCNPAASFDGFNCDNFCGDCNKLPNPPISCNQSISNCRWDNASDLCISTGEKSCSDQSCFSCHNESSCTRSQATSGCKWDNTNQICSPKSGSFEICYDGVDNDNNGFIDCSDFKCSSDRFCSGVDFDANNCFQYDVYTYGTPGAQNNCTSSGGCSWFSDELGYGNCYPNQDMCWKNYSLATDEAGCKNFNGGDTCEFISGGTCRDNRSLLQGCVAWTTQNDCDNVGVGCKWNSAQSACDLEVLFVCGNLTNNADRNLCETSGCYWRGDEFNGTFEGTYNSNCVSPCMGSNVNNQVLCEDATNTTGFFNGTCQWTGGYCRAKNFMGDCSQKFGDISACQGNNNCYWDEKGREMKILPVTTGNSSYGTAGTWLGVGLQRPVGGSNESVYVVNWTNSGKYFRIEMTGNQSTKTLPWNISRAWCGTGTSINILLDYNWTNSSGITGTFDKWSTFSCNSVSVLYILNTTSGVFEGVFQNRDVRNFSLDNVEGGENATITTKKATINLDGQLLEGDLENSSSGDGVTNASRVLTSSGTCEAKILTTFYSSMDSDVPTLLVADVSGDHNGSGFLDILSLGVKKTPKAYAYAIKVDNVSDSIVCKNIRLPGGETGNGTNTSKYYLYLDTNSNTTDNCPTNDNASNTGYEYLFKYIAQANTENKTAETTLSQRCFNSTWVATNIPFQIDRAISCDVINGAIFAIDRDVLGLRTDVNTSAHWRAFATTAGVGGNSSNISDKVGPGITDLKGIDVQLVDCASTKDKDNSQCTKFKQFGFFPGEFGPACGDGKDNDGDGLTDCNDWDCIYDPFFCSGTFTSKANDKNAPQFIWNKVNTKPITAMMFVFGNDEPANGTVRFFHTDKNCSSLNAILRDQALDDGDTLTDYRTDHKALINNLSGNTTYFYKLAACDPSNNCAVSSCSNATTSSKHSNVTFKIDIPKGWTMDMVNVNLSNFTGKYALKVASNRLRSTNITINETTSDRSIKFIGLSIFEKQTLNISSFITGSGFLGLDGNQYQSFKQRTGLEKTLINIPVTQQAQDLQHCDDTGASCQNVTTNVNCTFTSTFTTCTVPDGVGLGFSSYRSAGGGGGATAGSGDTGGTGGSGGGSGGGGGSSSNGTLTSCENGYTLLDGACVRESGVSSSDDGPKESNVEETSNEVARNDVVEEPTALVGAAVSEGEKIGRDRTWLWISSALLALAIIMGFYLYRTRER